ncbi:DUF481 domain-containing protein [Shewanella insulae]|uniref:DUF481 domain-containing protein n=1 Tax=Shewanella insulae TaxID=2681496 RepID=UPI001EFEBFBF|nr:DUF481 domain-containing protein [Shewanella insulae]MCG9738145.1 DUF481 domain-containing protein [Shewanella insulae]
MAFRIDSSIIAWPLMGALLSAPAMALDWRLGIGGHDYYVDEADSHTLGAGVSIALTHLTEREIKLTGELNIFVDHDVDELDPDHIPVWFSSYYSAGGDLFSLSQHSRLFWDVSLGGKRNTVSSVEKQVRLFPALGYGYQREGFQADVKLGGGYYFLEIDDDVPRMRGYDREDFQNKTGAYTLAAATQFVLGKDFELNLAAQQWHDGSDWLESQLEARLSYDADHWSSKSQLIFSVKYNEYNLDPYARVPVDSPDYLPILPWNKDLFVRVYFDMPWG